MKTSTHMRNRRRFKSGVDPMQQKSAALTIVGFMMIVLFAMGSSFQSDPTAEKQESLRRQKARFTTSKYQDPGRRDYGNCVIEPAVVPEHRVQSTFTASYPGSGAKMTWKLIEAMTGLVTGDDFQLNGHENIVSIKTHYPSSEGRPLPGAESITRAMLLIRNPLYSIPSYFNFLYEYQNDLPGHSTRAPLDEWIKWRNANFDRQLEVWRRHAEYWMDNYREPNRIIVQYEKLVDDDLGPEVAQQIARFLDRSNGVTARHQREIPCIWHTIVKYKKSATTQRRLEEAAQEIQQQLVAEADPQSKRGGPKYIAPFTQEQQRHIMNTLTTMMERFKNEPVMRTLLAEYIDELARRAEGPPEDENTIVSQE